MNKHILLVDDDAHMRNIVIDVLEKQGFVFCQAKNGLEGYEIACSETFDLIITDWEMPLCNGLEFIQKLKQNSETREIPVIMLTGVMTSSYSLQAALDLGAKDFINKPIDETVLKARVNSLFQLFKAHREKLEIQAQLAASEEALLRNKLTNSRNLLVQKIAQLAHLSQEKNICMSHLKALKAFCNKEGEDLIASHIRDMQVEKQRNVELEFMVYFESLKPDFFEKIGDVCSILTPKEQKICAMVSLSLSNKEISAFFSNSESTIKSARKIIRKKLGLEVHVDLCEYLNAI